MAPVEIATLSVKAMASAGVCVVAGIVAFRTVNQFNTVLTLTLGLAAIWWSL